MMKKLLLTLSLLLPLAAQANEGAFPLNKAPLDTSNQASLQRGFKVFANNCLNCHGAVSMRYNRLRAIGLSDEEIKAGVMSPAEKIGDLMQAGMAPADAKAGFGVVPPDLSVIARSRTPDWLYTYLRSFYADETRPSGWSNTQFPGVAMPHVLVELQGEQRLKVVKTRDASGREVETEALVLEKPGSMSPTEYNAMIADLVNYLAFMAEPARATRIRLGIVVVIGLGILFLLALMLKKEYWKDVPHSPRNPPAGA